MKKMRSKKNHAGLALRVAAVLAAMNTGAWAADKTWDGGGADGFWQTPLNWADNLAPLAGDRLMFTGTTRTSATNNFPIGTLFNGLTIANPAGPFVLRGNGITLGGGITNSQTLVPEVIAVPLALNGTRSIDVIADGDLTLSGQISGSGGLTKVGDGQVSLTASNTFDGTLTINSGTVAVPSDASLGVAPGSATAGKIVINGGSLRTTANMTLDANRGIAVGPATGTGKGAIAVNSGATLAYGGVISNNGGTGGLTKSLFGNLTLFNANTYTGPTVVENGTLTLDFGRSNATVSANIISANSSLVMGGANAGLGAASYDALVVNGRTNGVSTQTFNGASVVTGPAIIRANSAGSGSTVLNLGALTHTPGGVVAFTAPASGEITTTTPNVNGVLGGWATIGSGTVYRNITMGTDLAAVDGSGRIVPYTGYRQYGTGEELSAIASAGTNVRITGDSAGDLTVSSGSGVTVDVNSITLANTRAMSLNIGAENTLRLGKFGTIFKSDFVNNITWALGSGTVAGGNGQQDVGTLTAGGADNADGEIVFYMNNNASQSQGSLNVEAKITDNGTGRVSVVKVGPGSMKLRGHNTFSGGLYLLQGRLQLAGSELSATGGTGNHDGGGTGPIYVFPGAYIFPSGSGTLAISNKFFIAGLGTDQEQVGAIRFGNGTRISGDVEMIGDSRIGGGNAANVGITGIYGKVSGRYNLDIGALGTINSFISLHNPSNDWTGTTTINARNTATANGFQNGASEVIPHGVGKGNVVMNGNTSTGTIYWNLNGFDETINGLSSIGFLGGISITNTAAGTNSTLTIGDYDQSATFGGVIADGAGSISVTKIGGGNQTFTAAQLYTGPTKIMEGTITLQGAASVMSTQLVVNPGATLDVSGVTGGFAASGSVDVNGGTLVINGTTGSGINQLSLSNATLRVSVDTTKPVALANNVNLRGTTTVDISAVLGVTSYPTQFTIVKYTTPLAPGAVNLLMGAVPSISTQGYLSNNVANGSIDLYLVDGPKPLTWRGNLTANWDLTSLNWLAFGVTPVSFLNSDSAVFNDSAVSTGISLTTKVSPAAVTFSNSTLTYSLMGTGSIGGSASLTKSGSGRVILAMTGTNDFTGGITINGGTLQVGTNGTGGNLPAGGLLNNGSLVINRSGSLAVNSDISGSGDLTINGSGTVTLGGVNTYDGATLVTSGTVRAGAANIFGSEIAGTTVTNGATLDINGRSLGGEIFTVSGAGAGAGVIVNTGAESQTAIRNLVLAGDTTFGGTGRWDIRSSGGIATLYTAGTKVSLTKTGSGEISLAGVDIDPLLGDVNIQQGLLRLEGATANPGAATNKLTVATGATLQFNNYASPLDKVIELNGNGATTTVGNTAGEAYVYGPITLNSNVVFNIAGGGLTLQGPIGGAGSLIKNGAGALNLTAAVNYTGDTTINAGTLALWGDAALSGTNITLAGSGNIDLTLRTGNLFTLANGQTLRGSGGINGLLTANAGSTVSPGGTALGTLSVTNNVNLSGTTRIDLNKTQDTNDVINATGIITYGGTLNLNVMDGPVAANTVFRVFNAAGYSGSFGTVTPATPGSGQTWDLSQLPVDGTIKVLGNPTGGTPATLAPITYANGTLTFSGTGGTPNATFDVLFSSDITAPVSTWTVDGTARQFNATGGFNFNMTVTPGPGQRFYMLRQR